jgi:hypothetical protein
MPTNHGCTSLYEQRICPFCWHVYFPPADAEMLCPHCHCSPGTIRAADPKPLRVQKLWKDEQRWNHKTAACQ